MAGQVAVVRLVELREDHGARLGGVRVGVRGRGRGRERGRERVGVRVRVIGLGRVHLGACAL